MKRLVLVAVVLLLAAPDQPPSYEIDDDYVAVRRDVLAQMNASDVNLPECEKALSGAQKGLQEAEEQIKGLRAAIDQLTTQKTWLEAHVRGLEEALGRGPTVGESLVAGWEDVDAAVACGGCWALGTAQCLGLAWIFNQEGMRTTP